MISLRVPGWLATLAAVAALAALGGCGTAGVSHVVVPLQGNPAGEVAAESCVLHCRASSSIERCMMGCPGAVALPGACRHDDAPPVAMCRVAEDGPLVYRVNATDGGWHRPPPDDSDTPASTASSADSTGAAGEVITGVASALVGAALASSSGSSSSSSSSGSSRSSTPATGARYATREEPVARTAATPSRGESSGGRTLASPTHSEPPAKHKH